MIMIMIMIILRIPFDGRCVNSEVDTVSLNEATWTTRRYVTAILFVSEEKEFAPQGSLNQKFHLEVSFKEDEKNEKRIQTRGIKLQILCSLQFSLCCCYLLLLLLVVTVTNVLVECLKRYSFLVESFWVRIEIWIPVILTDDFLGFP
jgi:hypothetical protein